MTLLTYTGLVLTLATIHEYVPYKCSTMLIIAVVMTIPGFRQTLSLENYRCSRINTFRMEF